MEDNWSYSQTIETCIRKCMRKNFAFAGVQYGGQCWCGNTLPGAGDRRPSSECNNPCSGDENQMCGGGLRNNVYRTGNKYN